MIRVRWIVAMVLAAGFGAGLHGDLRGDIIYGSSDSGSAGNAIYSIDTTSYAATLLAGGLAVTPNSLATDSGRQKLYYGDSNGTTIWNYDLQSGAATQVFDISSSAVFAGLTNPVFADGGSFFNGSYYALIQRDFASGEGGAGNSLYRFDLSTDGNSVVGVTESTLNTPSGLSVGDLGDFTIDQNGIAFGNSWDPPGSDTQLGGYWTFDMNDPSNTFSLVQDTSGLGNNAPTYQLATGADGTTIFGVDFFTPLRLDTLDIGANITPGSSITGFDGTQFNDLASAVFVAVPEPNMAVGLAGLIVGLALRRRRVG